MVYACIILVYACMPQRHTAPSLHTCMHVPCDIVIATEMPTKEKMSMEACVCTSGRGPHDADMPLGFQRAFSIYCCVIDETTLQK